jgi:hypothetical protein
VTFTLYEGCPYLDAKISKLKESGCVFKLDGNKDMISLKGEKVRNIYCSIHKKQNTLIKSVDFIIFASNDKTDKIVLLVEVSNHIHKLSELCEKFQNSLNHLKAMCFCDKENLREISIRLIITYKKIRNTSEFRVISTKEFSFEGKKFRFNLNRCDNIFSLK